MKIDEVRKFVGFIVGADVPSTCEGVVRPYAHLSAVTKCTPAILAMLAPVDASNKAHELDAHVRSVDPAQAGNGTTCNNSFNAGHVLQWLA